MNLFAGENGDFLTSDLIERVLSSSRTSIGIPEIFILDDTIGGEGLETIVLELVDPKFLLKPENTLEQSTTVLDTLIFIHRNFSQLKVSIEDDDGKSVI